LAMLLQRFRLASVPEADVKYSLMFLLRAKQIPMVIHAQDRQAVKVPVRGKIHDLVDLTS
jgi:hypothetical protein